MAYPPLLPDSAEPTFASAAELRLHRRRETALGYRILGAHGWGATGDGHISARDPELLDHFWLARYGVPFNQVTLNDIVLVGPNGTVVDAPGGIDTGINPAAFLIHWPLHEAREDVMSACHTHTGYGTPFAAQRRLFQPISQESCAFIDQVAMFDDEELDIVTLDGGKRIAAALGDKRHAILCNHGLVSTGGTVAEAVGWFVSMERIAEVHMKAGSDAKPISHHGAREVARSNGTPEAAWSMFQWLARRHIPDPSVIG
jgi:ribulose-5-phosphate 4-epimerase/fuculose-1-phosphate aldolase